jgi:hypothetical protein
VLFYWLLFSIPVFMMFSNGRKEYQSLGVSFGLFLVIIIGLRYQVGGDWYTYLDGMDLYRDISLDDVLLLKFEVGFNILSWVSQQMGASIYGVNFVCAIIFVTGFTKLSNSQPYSWLAATVAVPYLIVVVAMGYTRQAAAIGFLMFSLEYLLKGRIIIYLLMVVLASSFHKTAIIFSALPLLQPGGGWIRFILGLVIVLILGSVTVVIEQAETYYLHYVEENMESSGGLIRVLMNLPPALILITNWKKWNEKYDDRWLWACMALLALACIPLVLFASTAVDRMALYLIPLQLVAWSRFPAFIGWNYERSFFAITLFYATVLLVWISFGNFSSSWIPYDNLLFPSF